MYNFDIWIKEFERERKEGKVISIRRICLEAGITRATYYNYKNGKRTNPSIQSLNALRLAMDSLKKQG